MKIKFLLSLLLCSLFMNAQEDEAAVQQMYNSSLSNGMSYVWLEHLSNSIGGRLSGSTGAQKAVEYTKSELEKLGLDKVWLQPVMVPKWVRGAKETCHFISNDLRRDVNICALGGSVATPAEGLTGEVIEVNGIQELKDLIWINLV